MCVHVSGRVGACMGVCVTVCRIACGGGWVSGRVVGGWVAHTDKRTKPLVMHIYACTHAHTA